jgi:hypothetical protein
VLCDIARAYPAFLFLLSLRDAWRAAPVNEVLGSFARWLVTLARRASAASQLEAPQMGVPLGTYRECEVPHIRNKFFLGGAIAKSPNLLACNGAAASTKRRPSRQPRPAGRPRKPSVKARPSALAASSGADYPDDGLSWRCPDRIDVRFGPLCGLKVGHLARSEKCQNRP